MTLTDEHSPSARRPSPWSLGIATVVVLATAVWGVIATTSPDEASQTPSSSSSRDGARNGALDAAALDAIAGPIVEAQQQALASRDRAAYLGSWGPDPASQRQARLIFTNLGKLTAETSWRWVRQDSVTGIDPGSAWDAKVEVTWRSTAGEARAASTTLMYTFGPVSADTAKVVAVRQVDGGRRPVWLTAPLQVRKGAGWLIAAGSAHTADQLARTLPSALRHVQDAVGRRADVAVYAPGSSADMETIAGAAPGQFDGIAAATISVDGSRRRTAPVAVMLNPDVFGRLDARGRTVVIAHEITHAVTGAANVDMPLWLAEGFADYVAISAVEVPVQVSARLALRSAGRAAIPRRLPGQAAFGRSGPRLEVAYEQSWLVARSIAQHQGEAALLDFYRRVVAEPAQLRTATREELGISLDQLTRQWRIDVQGLLDG